MIKCVVCLKNLSSDEFEKEPKSKLGYRKTCHKCLYQKRKARKAELKALAKDPAYPALPKNYRINNVLKLDLYQQGLKECGVCKNLKSLSNFYLISNSKTKHYDKHQPRCKECAKAYTKEWFLKKNLPIREYLYEYRISKGCFNCGNKDPRVLEFDHLRNKKFNLGKAHTIKGLTLTQLKAEVKKCVVLCYNCHKIKTHKEQDTWLYQKFVDSQVKESI